MDLPPPSPPIPRRDFLRRLASGAAALAVIPAGAEAEGPASTVTGESTSLVNEQFDLYLAAGIGLHCRLVHRPSGTVLADGEYSYSFGTPHFGPPSAEAGTVVLRGKTGTGLEVEHRFTIGPDGPWIEEEIALTNRGAVPHDLHRARAGFVLPVALEGGVAPPPWTKFKFTAIPFRREPDGHIGQYADFPIGQILTEQLSSGVWTGNANGNDNVTFEYAAEGWSGSDGQQGFLISKYSPKGMEWALLDGVALAGGQAGLRWGGFGIYRRNPEHGAWLLPGKSHRFGVTRLTAFSGDFVQGCYAFRAEMEKRGHGCPGGFDPPVHWNELYDNPLFFLPGNEQDDPEMRKKYYTLEDMKVQAGKAKEIGCEALYLDPGWDTNFASKIWDEARLGSYKSFTTMLARDYGLKSSLHTPIAGWCNPTSYPTEAYRMDRWGQRLSWRPGDMFNQSPLCGASEQYLAETAKRLKALARDGAAFFMFDGTTYRGECWDPAHGHAVPSRTESHVQATCRLARLVHAEHPKVLIEMHDSIAGNRCHYIPIYYGHGPGPVDAAGGQAEGFDSVWAFELMWRPMEDLLSGRAIALYYYNLAYSVPLYIHIDLRTDNANTLVFWWNASTCRHLGIGGTHPDPAVRRAQAAAMKTYRELAEFYKAGIFYGLEEAVHIHRHPSRPAAVVNCFNFQDQPVRRTVAFQPESVGLPPNPGGGPTSLAFDLPARGHALARIGT